MPSTHRKRCLEDLNRMSINYVSLFPDLAGACVHCNMALELGNYDPAVMLEVKKEIERTAAE